MARLSKAGSLMIHIGMASANSVMAAVSLQGVMFAHG